MLNGKPRASRLTELPERSFNVWMKAEHLGWIISTLLLSEVAFQDS